MLKVGSVRRVDRYTEGDEEVEEEKDVLTAMASSIMIRCFRHDDPSFKHTSKAD